MAIVDWARSGDSSQDEAVLRRALPTLFRPVAVAQMALPLRPIFGPEPSQHAIEQEGRLLLSEFVTQEIRRNHVQLDDPPLLPDEDDPGPDYQQQHVSAADLVYSHLSAPSSSTAIPSREEVLQSHPMFRHTGRELAMLADEFARSRERERVKQQADSLSVDSITRENLMALMNELFHDGFSRERLVTLFFFCSDLIIRALRESQEGGRVRWEILTWVWEFFCERVCSWVREHGGWENVLCNYLPKAVMVTTGVAITAGIAFYIWKNW